jgi:PAT family beta-lactamase induction signal transducer AmpG
MTLACLPVPKLDTRPGAYLRQTFVTPILDFFTRFENLAGLILAMICFYRVADFLLNINGAFYLDLGFEKTVIGEVRKIFGVVMTILGVSTAGIMLTRMGMKFSLIVGGIVGALSNLAYAWLATKGADVLAFSIALGIDNVSGGIAGTVLIAYMSSLISKNYAASQYALFSSLYAMPGKLIASQSGRIVESLAKGADNGGLGDMFLPYMKALPATAYAKPAQALGVTAQALASSYAVFFVYTSLIGLISVALAIWLIQKPQIEKVID